MGKRRKSAGLWCSFCLCFVTHPDGNKFSPPPLQTSTSRHDDQPGAKLTFPPLHHFLKYLVTQMRKEILQQVLVIIMGNRSPHLLLTGIQTVQPRGGRYSAVSLQYTVATLTGICPGQVKRLLDTMRAAFHLSGLLKSIVPGKLKSNNIL